MLGDKALPDDPAPGIVALYGDMPGDSRAMWSEPAAERVSDLGEIKVAEKAANPNLTPEAASEQMAQFKTAAVASGLGRSTTAELFGYAQDRVLQGGAHVGTKAEALAELRSVWGPKTGERLKAIETAVMSFDQKYPVRQFMRAWNLDNDPRFMRLIWARIAATKGR